LAVNKANQIKIGCRAHPFFLENQMSQVKTVKIKDGDDFRVINESDFKYGQHELYEGEKLSTDSVVVNLEVGITPELQATIDEAKAECEKVVAENESLKEQITVLENGLKEYSDLMSENSRLKEQQTLSEKNTSELQATIEGLNKTIKSLEAKLKKPTAAEAKTAKAADEAAKVDEPKE